MKEKEKKLQSRTNYIGYLRNGIFCRADCQQQHGRSLLLSHIKEALEKGFRPCLTCLPHHTTTPMPSFILTLLTQIEQSQECITTKSLLDTGFDLHTLHHWFNKHYALSVHHYQRLYHRNLALNKICHQTHPFEHAYQTGFKQLNMLSPDLQDLFSPSPHLLSLDKQTAIHHFHSPIGSLFAAANQQGLCLLEFSDQLKLEKMLKKICYKQKTKMVVGINSHIEQTKIQLNEYFNHQRQQFDIPLNTIGTDFQQHVWQALQKIPYGQTHSYQQQALLLGRPNAVRAVANANGMNCISIIIPCHRVIGSRGELTGYGGGVWRKNYLLVLEKNEISS